MQVHSQLLKILVRGKDGLFASRRLAPAAGAGAGQEAGEWSFSQNWGTLGVERADVQQELQPGQLVIDQGGGHGVLRRQSARPGHPPGRAPRPGPPEQHGGALHAAVGQLQRVLLDLVVLPRLLQRAQPAVNALLEVVERERQAAQLGLERHQRGAVVVALGQPVDGQVQLQADVRPRPCPDRTRCNRWARSEFERRVGDQVQLGLELVGGHPDLALAVLKLVDGVEDLPVGSAPPADRPPPGSSDAGTRPVCSSSSSAGRPAPGSRPPAGRA